MHDLETIKRLNEPAKLTAHARHRRERAERAGWVPYPRPLTKNGQFDEHLPTIIGLVGSTDYEWKQDTQLYVRRLED